MAAPGVLESVQRISGASSRSVRWLLLVSGVALVPRLGFVLHGAGLGGTYGYDPSVYYAASDAILHGQMPYRDYVLLHPPGIALLLTPFAALGELTTDHAGFIAANLAFTLLGAMNAALVVLVARRMGLRERAALVGGLFYAVWFGAVGSEYLIRLEPLGNALLLCGLLAHFAAQQSGRRGTAVLCGACFGAAAAVKIWWIVALLIVLAWHLPKPRRRPLAAVAAGAAAALVCVCGPFFLAAPRQMWSMIVLDQLHRVRNNEPLHRLVGMTGVGGLAPHLTRVAELAVLAGAALVLVTITLRAWRVPAARLVVCLAIAQLAVLATSPSWFAFYDDSLAPPLALTLGAALHTALARPRRKPAGRAVRATGATALAALTAGAALACIYLPEQTVYPYPSKELSRAVANARCVMSDSPMALIELDVLNRGFADHCRNWVDVTGRTYGADAPSQQAATTPRRTNAKWQRDLTAYLMSGDAVTLFRAPNTGIGPRLRRLLHREPVLARSGGFTVYGTAPVERGRAGTPHG